MIKIFVGSLMACVLLMSAEDKKVEFCTTIFDNAERLKCYDSIFIKNENTIQDNDEDTGLWKISTDDDLISGNKDVYLSLDGKNGEGIIIRCKNNKTEFFIVTNKYLGSGIKKVRYKIDNRKPKVQRWNTSSDGQALFYRGNDIKFIKSLFGHEKMIFEYSPYGKVPEQTMFTISGLREAIKPLRKACGW